MDDEVNLVDLVRGYLAQEGFAIEVAFDGLAAIDRVRDWSPDVVILDVMLPGVDGIEVCRRVRTFSDAYVLMLTARAEEIDKIVGLSVGADDYLTKPFSPRELVARVRAMLRRPRRGGAEIGTEAPPQRIGDLEIDRGRFEARLRDAPLPLTQREFSLLAALAERPGRVYTRGQLLDRVWGNEHYDEHVVEVHIANLRRKIEPDPATPRYVHTVRGVGYRFEDRS